MKTRLAAIMAQSVVILLAQIEINYSYEMKYGDGKKVTKQVTDNPETTDYTYFENL